MSVEYWRDITTDRVAVVEIDDVTDTISATPAVMHALLDRAGFVQMDEWPEVKS